MPKAALTVGVIVSTVGVIAIAIALFTTGSRAYDNCKQIEGVKALIRGTLSDARANALLRPGVDFAARQRIILYYDRELERYKANDCSL